VSDNAKTAPCFWMGFLLAAEIFGFACVGGTPATSNGLGGALKAYLEREETMSSYGFKVGLP